MPYANRGSAKSEGVGGAMCASYAITVAIYGRMPGMAAREGWVVMELCNCGMLLFGQTFSKKKNAPLARCCHSYAIAETLLFGQTFLKKKNATDL